MSKLAHCLECDWKGEAQELIDKTTLNGGDECVCPNCGSFEGIETEEIKNETRNIK